ncbi:hypothetical protein HK096_009199 [Nowakowskiella sp. JEL0078]|nr:hypothetical protein HK096_009199 [Nowakowskiella sp. JEL0078]
MQQMLNVHSISRLASVLHNLLVVHPALANPHNTKATEIFYEAMITKSCASPLHVLMAIKFIHMIVRLAEKKKVTAPLGQSSRKFQSCGAPIIIMSSRILITVSLMLAVKVMDDRQIKNSAWAQISGVAVDVLNKGEREVLAMLGYGLWVKKEQFDQWIEFVLKLLYSKMKLDRLPDLLQN